MLFPGFRSVRMVKNCDRGLENAARGSQFFTIRTDLKPANNVYEFVSRNIDVLAKFCLRDQKKKLKSTISLRIHVTECTEMKAIHYLKKTCASRSRNRSLLLWPLVSLHHLPCLSLYPFPRSLSSYFPFPSIHSSPPPFLLRSFLHHSVH